MQAHAMNHHPATLLALLFVSLLLVPLLLRLRLAAFYDTALTLHLLVRLRIRPVTVRLPGPDGTTMRVWCPASPSSKPPLLLLHGFGGDAKWTWVQNFAALSSSFHVYAPDLVFFGSSSRSASPLRSVAFQARCSADAMRILGVPHYHIAGISYGGFVAYRMAAVEARECVGRLVIMTSAVAASTQEITALAAREEIAVEDALMPETVAGLRRLLCRIMHSPPRLPDFLLLDIIQMFADQRKERSELLRELLQKGVGIDLLPALNQKTLLLWGDKDQVFPVDLGYRLQRHLGDDCRLEIIKDAGHALQIEEAGKFVRQADDPWYIAYQDKSTQWCSQRMDLEEKVANLGDELARKNLMIFELKRLVEEEKKSLFARRS
ncbi:hypothetical protein QYE76_055261 [Lolium multiflorum]|uniref:AB hydrolase-1 domain-containing protein n=1 Tax=Lolium multiflorum TaxID=4521 RepID=A0AAD8WLP2_LOLMU|nr:hypothetical protein QYE76_055261 [Lolium multiflorum]